MSGGGSRRLVVVGASLAGLRAAEAARKAGHVGELTVIGAEPHMPYNRPPLSKAPLADALVPEWLRPGKLVADVAWRLGEVAVSGDLGARTIRLMSGEVLDWDGLVVATGLRPRRLVLPGPTNGRHVVRSLADVEGLRAELVGAASVIIIGAGFIGCEVAAVAAAGGLRAHVVAPEFAPIERPLGVLVGGEVRRRLEGLGVQFHLGTVPVAFHGEDRAEGVILADGSMLTADVVVEAVGSAPNVEWLEGNGLDLSDGLLCDSDLRVEGRPDVVACGDVARFPNLVVDSVPRRVEHWMTAVDTAKRAGQVIGAYLSGGSAPTNPFIPLPSFWSHQASIRIQSFGSPHVGLEDVRVLEGQLAGDVAVGYHRGGQLVGVVLLGLPSRYMHYRRLLEEAAAPAART